MSETAQTAGGAMQVARNLGLEILSGAPAPGAVLPTEIALAARWGVGRNQMREALAILAAKGLIQSRKKAGTRVLPRAEWRILDADLLEWRLAAGPELGFARDLLELRRAVEPAAAAAAARRRDADGIAAAMALMEASATDHDGFVAADLAFHRAVLAASGNEVMAAMGATIAAALRAVMAITMRGPDAPRPSIPLHRAVLTAIAAGDAGAARAAMEALLNRTAENIEREARR